MLIEYAGLKDDRLESTSSGAPPGAACKRRARDTNLQLLDAAEATKVTNGTMSALNATKYDSSLYLFTLREDHFPDLLLLWGNLQLVGVRMTVASDFVFTPQPSVNAIGLLLTDLEPLVGPWAGTGFNTIWRPHFSQPPDPPNQDRFLELNLTNETLDVHRIHGLIPNRGLDQIDINMRGVHYLQQIADQAGGGLHLEPGIWALVPSTTAPAEPQTVVRMASIPHGTTILAQGTATVTAGAPVIPDVNILPFRIGAPAPAQGDFDAVAAIFTELALSTDTPFRLPEFSAQLPAITQDMVKNPAKVIQDAVTAIGAANFIKTITLDVSTTNLTPGGGGTSNTIFLENKNADASIVNSTFWVSTFKDATDEDKVKNVLIYSQTVMLDFNNLRWPHVTVAVLRETT